MSQLEVARVRAAPPKSGRGISVDFPPLKSSKQVRSPVSGSSVGTANAAIHAPSTAACLARRAPVTAELGVVENVQQMDRSGVPVVQWKPRHVGAIQQAADGQDASRERKEA